MILPGVQFTAGTKIGTVSATAFLTSATPGPNLLDNTITDTVSVQRP